MRILLLDRDGTIIENVPYVGQADKVRLVEEAVPVLKLFTSQGYRLSVVSNQSGVGRNLITIKQVRQVNDRVDELLRERDLYVDYYYFCPHSPLSACRCRKPATRLITSMLDRYGADKDSKVYLIGDSDSDILAAKAVGVQALKVKTSGVSNQEGGMEWSEVLTWAAEELSEARHWEGTQ